MNELNLSKKIAASINGTNGTSIRVKCPTPEDFYQHWIKTQIKRNRMNYVDYADKYKPEIMYSIYQLYAKKPKAVVKTNTNGKQIIKQFIAMYKHDTQLMDWANKAIFPYTSNYQKWLSKKD
jgi:methionine synthase I (cobalamin-dependent)